MERIRPLSPPYPEGVAQELAAMMPPGVPPLRLFRCVAHNSRVLSRLRTSSLLGPGSISLRQRELVILRTTARCGAEYEWGIHVAFFADKSGFSKAQIDATVRGSLDVFDARESVLIEFCDALHDASTVEDELWDRLRKEFQDDQLIELIALIGQYHTVSFFTQSMQIELEPGSVHFPA